MLTVLGRVTNKYIRSFEYDRYTSLNIEHRVNISKAKTLELLANLEEVLSRSYW